ncbi:MAG: hypothetical protein CMH32_03660 [Micavibrio sp.]|nr:hypothetical protein [Micavibrio sp.]HCK33178.1 hypothetical protein [Rhodospirillaceae bacterium]
MINSENLTFRLYLEKDMVFDSAPESGISADGVKAIFKDKAGKMYFALPQQLASMVEAATFYLSSNDVDQEKLSQCLRLLSAASVVIDRLGKDPTAKTMRHRADDLAQKGNEILQRSYKK